MRRVPNRLVAVAVAVGVVLSGSLVWSGLLDSKTIHVEVQLPVFDVDRIGAGTQLNVTVTNSASRPLTPSFWVMWSAFVPTWDILNGPPSLPSGSVGAYTIRVANIRMAIPNGAHFVVKVYDPNSGAYYRSATVGLHLAGSVPIQNPQFRFWSLDTASGVYQPFGWVTRASTSIGGSFQTAPQDTGSGATLSISHSGGGPGPSYVHLQQTLSQTGSDLLRTTGLTLCWQRSFDYRFDPLTGDPLAAAGLELFGGDRLAWFVLSSTGAATYNRSGHRIFVAQGNPALPGCVTVPIVDMIDFVRSGSQQPPALVVFVAAWPAAPGDYVFSLNALS